MKKYRKRFAAAGAAALLLGSVSSAALAFDDLEGVPQAASILELKAEGVVSGVGNEKFEPRAPIAARDAVTLIVRSLDLSLAPFSFIQPPQASDFFDRVPDDAWYAEAFVIARLHGVPLDRGIDPDGTVTREQFVRWLMGAVDAKGPFAWIELYIMLEDEADVSEGYMDAVQRALIAGIAKTDDDGRFRPKDEITRGEAAEMARNAKKFVKDTPPAEPLAPDPIEAGDVAASVVPVTPEISKIVLDMGERPHPGWNVNIESIEFLDEDSAVVRYSVSYPDPAALYPMVVTHPKSEQYIASAYTDIIYAYVGESGTIGGGAPSFPGPLLPETGPLPAEPAPLPADEAASPDAPVSGNPGESQE